MTSAADVPKSLRDKCSEVIFVFLLFWSSDFELMGRGWVSLD